MKRQIRLMFYALGYEVKRLTRVRIGPLQLANMPPGSWRVLTQKEIDSLLDAGAKGAAEDSAQRRVRKARPGLRSLFKRNREEGPKRPRVQAIAFTPRASRAKGEQAVERPRPARPAGKPFAKKAAGAKTRKPVGKAAPRPFAKFERRRAE